MMYHFDLPVRGAIDYGDILVQNRKEDYPRGNFQRNTIVLKPLVNAYMASEAQNWTGCVICENCEHYILVEHPYIMERLAEEKRVIRYDPPLKKGKII
jgi:hypothetical protein